MIEKIKKILCINPKLVSFTAQVNDDIDELNQLIQEYNISLGVRERTKKLKDILLYRQLIEDKCGDLDVSACGEFVREIQEKLFSTVKAELKKLDVFDLLEIYPNPDIPPSALNLSRILANMEPQKVNQFILILLSIRSLDKKAINKIEKLYDPMEEGYTEFRTFLETNSISFLGSGNTNNFKISPQDGGASYILKLENGLGNNRLPMKKLGATSVKNSLSPIYVERQGTVQFNEETVTRTLSITEFCSGGDLCSKMQNLTLDSSARIELALNYYEQMLDIISDLNNQGFTFLDMKNSNWLIDSAGKLKIADKKSILFGVRSNEFNNAFVKQKNVLMIQTLGFVPPEFYTHALKGFPISADKMHAYIVGKNLIQALLACGDYYFSDYPQYEVFHFEQRIFQTPKGKLFKELIRELVEKNPETRISLNDARLKLRSIPKKVESLNLLEKIHGQVLNRNIEMLTYVAQKKDFILKCTDPGLLKTLDEELNQILARQQLLNPLKIEAFSILKEIAHYCFEFETQLSEFIAQKKVLIGECTNLAELMEIHQELIQVSKDRFKIYPLKMENLALLDQILKADVQNQKGAFLKQTRIRINSLDNIEVQQRISEELISILNEIITRENGNLLQEIQTLGFGKYDEQMNEFQAQKYRLITSNAGYKVQQSINQELKNILSQQVAVNALKVSIQKSREKVGFFTSGLRKKVDAIEKKLCQMPVENRGKITDSSYEPGREIRIALELNIPLNENKQKESSPVRVRI